ncbi:MULTISPECIES: retropepsin-like aspartic protease family protein [Xanthobacter]|uniref:retropepsin-like aspartic protease family protein n=1 Tax=Xanthobacter TaxID=279 RepID=UPI001F1FB3E9|nr:MULTISPECIES: TIGR02281 family clan AA aspartic protease [unclassified Xanthobacter]
MLWVLLIILLIGLVVLVAHHDQGEVAGLSLDKFGALVALGSIGIWIGSGLLSRFQGRFTDAVLAAVFWLLLAVLLGGVYIYRLPLQAFGDRFMSQLVPGRALTVSGGGDVTVEIERGADGDFSVWSTVNGASVHMLVDTGASSVVLTQEDARAAGLPLDFITYDVPVDTANGRVKAAAVQIDNIIVGGIVERRVRALISPPGALRNSLLGMSFLSRLEAFEFRGNRLIMRGARAP